MRLALSVLIAAAGITSALPIQAQIVANPDTGIAYFGIASNAITNVAANDYVNGGPATLGASGNATVAISGTWPQGFSLSPTTGAISTTKKTPAKTYSLSYQLCDAANPTSCSVTPDSVTIATVLAPAIAGSVDTGGGIAIGNVAIPAVVFGAPAKLGASGNATVSQGSGWPGGFSLDPNTGAISSDGTPTLGNYTLSFTLCDLNAPPDCATGTATVSITQPFVETLATVQTMGDVEFDWGRDGVSCPDCNFGNGNNRANWTDRLGDLFIAHLDPVSGTFSANAEEEKADTHAYFWNQYGNGPEWAFSTQGGQVLSQLVYTRFANSQTAPPQPGNGFAGAALATQTGTNTWSTGFLPGAIVTGSFNSNLPEASQCNSDPVASAVWKNLSSKATFNLYTEPASTAAGTVPTKIQLPTGVQSNGIGERFVPCTHQLLFQAAVPFGSSGQTSQQIFWYDMDTGAIQQLTFDSVNKYSGFMFKAPDFGGNYILVTNANHGSLVVYQQIATNPNGAPVFQKANTIYSPLPDQQYLNTSEPFINCTPVCATYAYVTIAAGASQKGIADPNGLAIVALSPATPLFYTLVSADATPALTRQRLDPEYFITPQGPYVYYNRIIPLQPGVTAYKNQGEWFIDMQLGVPSGPCVGSSAEGGSMPGC